MRGRALGQRVDVDGLGTTEAETPTDEVHDFCRPDAEPEKRSVPLFAYKYAKATRATSAANKTLKGV